MTVTIAMRNATDCSTKSHYSAGDNLDLAEKFFKNIRRSCTGYSRTEAARLSRS